MSLNLEWGVLTTPDWYDGPPVIASMPDEETANEVAGHGQLVMFRYVGDWKRADA